MQTNRLNLREHLLLAKRAHVGCLAVALLCLAANSSPARAQAFANAAGFNAGGIWFSDFNAGSSGSPARIGLDPGWIVGLQFEHWFGSGILNV